MSSSISTLIDALQMFHAYKINDLQSNITFDFFHCLLKFEGCQEYQQEITEALKKVFCAQTQVPTDFLGKFYAEQFSKGLTKGLINWSLASERSKNQGQTCSFQVSNLLLLFKVLHKRVNIYSIYLVTIKLVSLFNSDI